MRKSLCGHFCQVELLVDLEESNLEESNTVVPVVATRKPVLERPTEEVGSFYKDFSFFHHYQGSIDFNIVNIHCTVEMYFFVSTGNWDDIE